MIAISGLVEHFTAEIGSLAYHLFQNAVDCVVAL